MYGNLSIYSLSFPTGVGGRVFCVNEFRENSFEPKLSKRKKHSSILVKTYNKDYTD